MARLKEPQTPEFDYIIVGSGAGGGPLAARLALRGCRVLVIEAGSNQAAPPRGPGLEATQVPAFHGVSTEHSDLSWQFFVKHYENPPAGPDPKRIDDPKHRGHDQIFYPRAAALGGCTIHNAMITIAGPDSDWDDLADSLKDESWSGARMRPYFQRVEHNDYSKPPTPLPTSWWGRTWYDLKWLLFGHEPDHRRGRHGFGGWLHTSVTDLSLGINDKQLVKMLKAALRQSKQSGLERTGTLVSTFLAGRIRQWLDPNHARTQAESPEGLALIPLAVSGERPPIDEKGEKTGTQLGRRSGPREFLLDVQAKHPGNLTFWTDCLVTKVLFDGGEKPRAVGVECLEGKRLYKAHVAPSTEPGKLKRVFVKEGGEVILCGGAFNTPQLLMLSGIGDSGELERISPLKRPRNGQGKEAESRKAETAATVFCCLYDRAGNPLRDADGNIRRIHSPGVGKNLQDRYEVTVISEMMQDFTLLRDATFRIPSPDDHPDRHLEEWRQSGTGLYTSNGAVLAILKRSRPDLRQPDLFIFGFPLPFEGYKPGYSDVGLKHNYFTWTILKSHTNNHDGTVTLQSSDPRDTPEINFHYFNESTREGASAADPDLNALVEGVKFVRGIAKHAKAVIKEEHHPGADGTESDEQLKDWVRRDAWGHHACGTCRMGADGDEKAVLDSRFRVKGVLGLRVVDASIFPVIPGYFIVTNIYMASEKAADVIWADSQTQGPDTRQYPAGLRALEAEAVRRRREQCLSDANEPLAEVGAGGWPNDMTGLALSGGGIRSATLNLGILQSLAKSRLLRRLDFLSTVSGGGYIGSFLGRFYDRLRPGASGCQQISGQAPIDLVEQELVDPESRMLDWLRRHGNYIAPRGKGDWRLGIAAYVRNFLSVQFVVGLLLFTLFGLANAIRYGLFDPGTAGLGLLLVDKGQLPLGHLMEALIGPFFSPWFMLFELLLLFLVLPKILGYWIVSQDQHQNFHRVALAILFLVGAILLVLGVENGLRLEPLVLGLAVFTSFVPVELAWRRGRKREEMLGSGGAESQRLRTRNYLTYDLSLSFTLCGAALAFAVIDSLGHGLQQVVENNTTYIRAFAAIGTALVALMPILRLAAGWFAAKDEPTTPPSTISRILKEQVVAGLMAVVFLTLPLVFFSFAAHAVYRGGTALGAGLAATGLAFLLSFLIRFPQAITFVNRSSLSQIYSARLARAYLGASNPLRHRPDGANITEVISGDDVSSIRDYKPHEAGGPLHLVNVVVNQTVDFSSLRGNIDRQGENVAVSCLGMSVGRNSHAGWADAEEDETRPAKSRRPVKLEPIGYFPGDDHPLVDETGQPTSRAEDLSLRRWIAISGAAMGPSRGQITSLGTALLFGLANVRTGYWWDSGISEVARDGFPKLTFLRRFLYILPEWFRTQSLLLFEWVARFAGPWSQYWNLSDGGFFENTGGYELVRRRVPRIILCDGSADPLYQFESFAEFVRKVRIDFNATVSPFKTDELNQHAPPGVRDHLGAPEELRPSSKGTAGKHASLYWIHYGPGDRKSVLLYVKATVTGDETDDIENYRASHPEFPHESTADQVFNESQWESYRQLGQHIATPLFQNPSWFWTIPLG